MRNALAFVALLTAAACGAGLSGRWSGTGKANLKDGTPITGSLFLALQQEEDGPITGWAGCDEQSAKPIENGKKDGSTILFEMTDPSNGVITTFRFQLVDGDTLRGESSCVVAGEHRRMTLTLHRVRPTSSKSP